MSIADLRLPDSRRWTQYAECGDSYGPDMFPHESDSVGIALAKEQCVGCPVRTQCLDEAITRGEPFGIWGGLTTDERRGFKRRRGGRPRTMNAQETAAALDAAGI